MSWPRPILTDSGGFQVFSLSDLRKVTDDGVTFRSHLDGSEHFLSPEKALEIRNRAGRGHHHGARRMHRSAARMNPARAKPPRGRSIGRAVRAIISRATATPSGRCCSASCRAARTRSLRRENADALVELDFPGYAIGGLAVGESHAVTCEMTQVAASRLPADRPRYLMGVGKPEQIPRLRRTRRGHDGLRAAHAQRAPRLPVYFTGPPADSQRAVCERSAARLTRTADARFAAGIPVPICGTFIPPGNLSRPS